MGKDGELQKLQAPPKNEKKEIKSRIKMKMRMKNIHWKYNILLSTMRLFLETLENMSSNPAEDTLSGNTSPVNSNKGHQYTNILNSSMTNQAEPVVIEEPEEEEKITIVKLNNNNGSDNQSNNNFEKKQHNNSNAKVYTLNFKGGNARDPRSAKSSTDSDMDLETSVTPVSERRSKPPPPPRVLGRPAITNNNIHNQNSNRQNNKNNGLNKMNESLHKLDKINQLNRNINQSIESMLNVAQGNSPVIVNMDITKNSRPIITVQPNAIATINNNKYERNPNAVITHPNNANAPIETISNINNKETAKVESMNGNRLPSNINNTIKYNTPITQLPPQMRFISQPPAQFITSHHSG
eukprot:UN06930